MSQKNSIGSDFEYILNVNKPVGKSSFSIVHYVRKLSGVKKVGHAGTLDPNASGVLLVVMGKATKQVEALMTMEKEYIGKIKLGLVTDTLDICGSIIEKKPIGNITAEEIRKHLLDFEGEILQTPPIYSALKYKGKPLYKYARKGEKIEPEPRKVNIYEISLISFNKDEAVIKVICSRGTYIRCIARDLGEKLGCGGTISELSRTRIGDYHIDDSVDWEDLPKKINSLVNE
ncbi:tRNA pseudouridine(55) synthase TruB [candidate division KSB1 bacterium]